MTRGEDPVFRAPMRARDRDDLDPGAGAAFGIEHGVVGIGPGRGEKAERMARRFTGLPDGAFVWTRDAGGAYRLGRVAGPARPAAAHDAEAAAVGLTWLRPTTWLERPFGEPEAPVAVVATFARGGRNLQEIHDAAVGPRSRELWDAAAPPRGAVA